MRGINKKKNNILIKKYTIIKNYNKSITINSNHPRLTEKLQANRIAVKSRLSKLF
jgi:hypothetical protein